MWLSVQGKDIKEDYFHPTLFHFSGSHMESDVYIEDLKLAIEYQWEQHYKPEIHHMSKKFCPATDKRRGEKGKHVQR